MADNTDLNRRFPVWRIPIDALVSLAPVAAVLRHLMHHVDRPLMRLTAGRFNLTMGLPSILLTTTGAKSGQPRSSPLLYVRLGDDIAIIGSRFGGNQHPGWVFNLRANPHAAITREGQRYAVTARAADPGERDRIWAAADKIYLGFAKYRDRVTAREIPMFVLTKI
jgi:deazaflavin-dependent oxidoreductase (nitroreductase family)